MTLGNRARPLGIRLGLIALLASGAGAVPGTLAAGYASTGSGPSAQGTWSIQPTPPIPNPEGWLSNISCTSASFCVAVGSDGPQPGAMAWNGHSWRFLPQLPAQTTDVSGVSCSSPAFCLVTGWHYSDSAQNDVALAEIWNGTRWATVSQAQPVGQLDSVSCSGPSACLAVGDAWDAPVERPLAEWWNGHQLSPVKVTAPGKGVQLSLLGSVSCSAVSACTAVGYYSESKTVIPLVERWNGTSLVRQMAAQPPGQSGGQLQGVSCPGTGGCVAVGYEEPAGPSFAEIWNGTTWTLMKSPTVNAQLSGVSCLTSTECLAVGSRWGVGGVHGGNNFAAYTERLSGTTWSLQPTPQPAHFIQSYLSGISCVQSGACIGAGSFTTESQEHAESLAEEWDGTRWAVQSVPNRQTPAAASFNGVSCAGSATCAAAGDFLTTNTIPLNESWNGAQWDYHSSPTPTSDDLIRVAAPAGVSCPATNMCIEVGKIQDANGNSHPWTARWNGTRWTTIWPPKLHHSPGFYTRADGLSSVSCVSISSCVAVGTWNPNASSIDPLAFAWNGTTWKAIPPVSFEGSNTMNGVSCTSATWCLAVGLGPGAGTPWITEAWNGSSWTVIPPSLPLSELPTKSNAVSCSSPAACTAVGAGTVLHPGQLAIERWNGTKWTAQQPAPLPPGASSPVFTGVSCASDTACTAVGNYTVNGTSVPVIQAWNGTSWTAESLPTTGSSDLAAVTCTTPSVCTAVGTENIGTADQAPLAERSG